MPPIHRPILQPRVSDVDDVVERGGGEPVYNHHRAGDGVDLALGRRDVLENGLGHLLSSC